MTDTERMIAALLKEVKQLRKEIESLRRERPNFSIIEGEPAGPPRYGRLVFDCTDGRWFYANGSSWIEIVP